MKVVIIAGGKGTRLKDIAKDIPKPMVPIAGKPILEYQIELAKRYGFTEIIILTGHLGEQIQAYFGDGAKWGVQLSYFQEPKPLGTAGCVKEIESQLTEDFFVFYGDTMMDVALDLMLAYHQQKKSSATLFLHPNDHPYDSDLVDIADDGIVKQFFPKPHAAAYYRNQVNAALYILSPNILKLIEPGVSLDFGKHIFPKALEQKLALYGYVSPEYIKDMGTPDRYDKVTKDVVTGKVASWNKHHKRKAIFLDRDGVLNKDDDLLINTVAGFNLLPGAVEAVKKINSAGYLAVVVTNQPVIARNLCDFDQLRQIHNKLETLLGNEKAFVDGIYFCPHHPDAGYPEERKEYKIICECRKPQPGMLLQAAKEMNIDLTQSYIVGDRETDILAGKNAGVKQTLLVKRNGEMDYNIASVADVKIDNVLLAVNYILEQ